MRVSRRAIGVNDCTKRVCVQRQAGWGQYTHTHDTTSVVHVNGSAASRATNSVIRTPEEAAYWRKHEACFSGNGVAPARI